VHSIARVFAASVVIVGTTLGHRIAAQVVRSDSAARVARDAPTHRLRTRQGSTFLGHLLSQQGDSVRFETNGGLLVLPRDAIDDIQTIRPGDLHDGEYWFRDPHATRLFFAPTGRMLSRGEGYYENTYLFINGVNASLGDRVSIGGSVTLVPSSSSQIGFVTPKLGLVASDGVNVAAGALVGYNGFGSGAERKFGIVYGVATFGEPDASVTTGLGWGYSGSGLARTPLLMLGGATRVSRRTALLTENYLVSSADRTYGVLGYGVRFFGEQLSVDLAFVNRADDLVFPGIPFVSFAVKFGRTGGDRE
jgi:hypothetical protein